MEKVREVLRLHDLGLNQSEISRSAKVSRRSVQDYINRAELCVLSHEESKGLSDSELKIRLKKRKPGRSKVLQMSEADFVWITKELQKKHVTRVLLWNVSLS